MIKQTHTRLCKIITREYNQDTKYAIKPTGLWYSIGDEWKDWCNSEMPDWMKGTKAYELEINMKDILVLENSIDVENFQNKYIIHEGRRRKATLFIDWDRVAQDYKGIEIPCYADLHFGRSLESPLWLYAWDVSSGCLFTTEVIENFKEVVQNEKQT